MRKLVLALGFFSLVSLCSSQILKIDFSGGCNMIGQTGIYADTVPTTPWGDVGGFSGTIIYNTDLLQESFSQDGVYWSWRYQTQQQVSLSITSGGQTYDNVSDFPYGSLASHTGYEIIEYTDAWGRHVTGAQKWKAFEVIYTDQPSHSGVVNSIKVVFGYNPVTYFVVNPFEPPVVFDPEYYTGNPTYGYKYGMLRMQTTAYSSTGELEGVYAFFGPISSCQVSVIPEPSTILLLGVGGYIFQKRRIKRRL